LLRRAGRGEAPRGRGPRRLPLHHTGGGAHRRIERERQRQRHRRRLQPRAQRRGPHAAPRTGVRARAGLRRRAADPRGPGPGHGGGREVTLRRPAVAALACVLALVASALRADTPAEKARKLGQKLATHKDPEERARAAVELGLLETREAVPPLLAALKDPAARVRIEATEALDRLSDMARDAGPALHPLLADPNLAVRFNAAVLLRKLDGATASELATAIAPLLADGDRDVRDRTFDMLFQLGPAEDAVREALIGALKLGPPEVRRQVALRLSRADLELRAGVWVLDLVPPLLDAIDHDLDPQVRLFCVHTLRDLRPYPREVLDGLIRALDDADAEVAGAAASSLNV